MNPLRCDEVKNSLVEYLEFELPLTDRERFYEHLAQCSQCRAVHDELQQVLTDVKSIDVVYPPQTYWDDLSGNVLNEIKLLRATAADESIEPMSEAGGFGHDISHDDSSDSNNVIVLSEIKSRKINESEKDKVPVYHREYTVEQVEPPKDRQHAAKRWPRIALPIAAAVLIGIATTFALLERQGEIYNNKFQDNIGFQAQIQSEQSLAELARKVAPLAQPGNQFGFATQKVLFNEFAIGSLFSEAKAYAAAGQAVELKTYLALLKTALQNEASTQHDIIAGVTQIQLQLSTQNDFVETDKELIRLLNGYVAAIKLQDVQRYNLARAGAWLFDYALAALAHDKKNVKQLSQLAELTTALRSSGVPPGVVKSLEKIQAIAGQTTFADRDYQHLLQEVENIRSLLG
ncbi:zf-HC2 domain-containing protein [Kaarinaea lacus]